MESEDRGAPIEPVVALYRAMVQDLERTQHLIAHTHLEHLKVAAATLGALMGSAPPNPVLSRRGLAATPCAASGRPMRGIGAHARIAIAGGTPRLRAALAEALAAGATIPVEAIDEATDAVVALHALEVRPETEALEAHLTALETLRRFARARGGRPGAFVIVGALDGRFGCGGGAVERAWLGGFSGMAKTAALEWPDVELKTIDVAQLDDAALARAVADECLRGGGAPEVGVGAAERVVPVEQELPPLSGVRAMPERPVVVVTGGARGVLPACLAALARTGLAPRIALLGRTSLAAENGSARVTLAELPEHLLADAKRHGRRWTPRELRAEVARITASREVHATLRALEAAGAEAVYHAVDVCDAAALGAVVAGVRARWGRIDALVHGAGVLADKLIVDQTPERFAQVFRTKVEGLRALLAATRDDDLRAIVLFSSVAARYGNPGQVAYAAANGVLNAVAHAESARRGSRCTVRALNWGPWDGGMVDETLRAHFAARGVAVIPLALGAQAFVRELLADGNGVADEHVDVVLAMTGTP